MRRDEGPIGHQHDDADDSDGLGSGDGHGSLPLTAGRAEVVPQVDLGRRLSSPTSLLRNPMTLFGGALAVGSLVVVVFLLIVEYTAAEFNPYVGILTYMVLPSLLVGGLILVPTGMAMTARKKRTPEAVTAGLAPPPYPSVDLNDIQQRRLALYFSLSTLVVGGTMLIVTYNTFQFMEEPVFCGQVCHTVMKPEFAAHERSSHARVPCVACHIGPGASWLVRSKISGMQQVWAVTTNSYPHPIESPIENLRPSRDTCEQCHWPERFYGDRLRTSITYVPDAGNTQQKTTQIFRVGSGGGDRGGIHWHTTSIVRYYALDEKREDIAWVSVESENGVVTTYEKPGQDKGATESRLPAETRLLDCIDCHNRAAHNFPAFGDLVDRALRVGELDASLPFLKKKALEVSGLPDELYTPETYKNGLQRIEAIRDFYRTEYPEIYQQKKEQISNTVHKLGNIYEETVFPEMSVGPTTYANWLSHRGCFRCHGKLARVADEDKNRQPIPNNCDLCHYMPSAETPAKKP